MIKLNTPKSIARVVVLAPILLAAGCALDPGRSPVPHIADAGSIKDAHPASARPAQPSPSRPAKRVVLVNVDAGEALVAQRRAPLRTAERRPAEPGPAPVVALAAPPPTTAPLVTVPEAAAVVAPAVRGSTTDAPIGPLAVTAPPETSRDQSAAPREPSVSGEFVALVDTPEARQVTTTRRAPPSWAQQHTSTPTARPTQQASAQSPARAKTKDAADDLANLAPTLRASIEAAELQMRIGNVKGARLMLEELVPVGGAAVMVALARTYDPADLDGMIVPPGAADPAKAAQLYADAASRGSAEASRRLQRLQAASGSPARGN